MCVELCTRRDYISFTPILILAICVPEHICFTTTHIQSFKEYPLHHNVVRHKLRLLLKSSRVFSSYRLHQDERSCFHDFYRYRDCRSSLFENILRSTNGQSYDNSLSGDGNLWTPQDEGLKKRCKEAFGVDENSLYKVHMAWSQARTGVKVKKKVDALARAHGQPVTFLAADSEPLVTLLKYRHGVAIDEVKLPSTHDAVLSSQAHFQAFIDGRLKVEASAHVFHFSRNSGNCIRCQITRSNWVLSSP